MQSEQMSHPDESMHQDPASIGRILSSTRLAPLWLIPRLYVGWIWMSVGWALLQSPAWMQGGSALHDAWMPGRSSATWSQRSVGYRLQPDSSPDRLGTPGLDCPVDSDWNHDCRDRSFARNCNWTCCIQRCRVEREHHSYRQRRTWPGSYRPCSPACFGLEDGRLDRARPLGITVGRRTLARRIWFAESNKDTS
jgi:hypothetical protein